MASRPSAIPSGFGASRRPRRPLRSRFSADGALALIALILAALGAAALWTLLAYLFSPLVAVALPIAAVVAVLIARQPVTGVYLAILTIPLERLGFAAGAADITPAKALLLLTGAVAVGHLAMNPGARRLHLAHAAFAGLLVVMAIGLAIAPEPFTTLKIVVQWSAYLAISMYLLTVDREQLLRVLTCLAIAGGILGAIAALTTEAQSVSGQAATGRAEGSFQHPAILAFFLVLALPVAIALSLRARAWMRPMLIAAAALCVAGITLSLTRGAILAAGVSLLIMLAWPQFRRVAGGLIVALIILAAFNWDSIERSQQFQVIGSRLQTITETRATQDNQRVTIWAKTPAIIADNPFIGVGAGNYGEISASYGITGYGGHGFVHAHNVLLTVAAEMGLIGLGLFLLFAGAIIATALGVLRFGRGSPDFPFALALFAALAGLFFNSLTDYPPSVLVIMAVVMIEVGLFIAFARRATARSAEAAG